MSGAQLSNYATFLSHPEQAPLSIVLTALSTAAGVVLTPVLALVLLGARIPVDAAGMAVSITQIVVAPVLAGRYAHPKFVVRITPSGPGCCTSGLQHPGRLTCTQRVRPRHGADISHREWQPHCIVNKSPTMHTETLIPDKPWSTRQTHPRKRPRAC